MTRCSKASSCGFSLVELILVVSLLAIITSITVPRLNYGAINNATVKTTAQRFASTLRLARSFEIANSGSNEQGYRVVIDTDSYSLLHATSLATERGPITIPAGVSTSGDTTFQFNRLGESSDGLGKTVTFSNSEVSYVVTMTGVGGIVQAEP
ncbi:MAG: prepilin-type N-terminal cleavage/methylation domain-containing protein [Bacteroidales bacterium]|nr:prepilin-type N-terminal cleavage/methylation domain-containing protein [Bacteroidales bacterium]